MKSSITIRNRNIYRLWECCGHHWEIHISNTLPNNYDWKARCPKCKITGKSFNEVTKSSHVKVD